MRSDYYLLDQFPEKPESEPVSAPIVEFPKARPRRRAVPLFILCLVLLLAGALFLFLSDRFAPPRVDESIPTAPVTTLPMLSPPGYSTLVVNGQAGAALSPNQVYEMVQSAVVSITADYGNGSGASGTGVLFDAQGYLVTNAHIIQGTQSAFVTLSTGESYPAFLIGMDEGTDLAVLKFNAEGALPYAVFGADSGLSVGDTVYALGNPLGDRFQGSMTEGIVSGINRNVTVEGREMSLIQTSAAINQGSSGGALVNQSGQVVGITNMKIMSTNSTVEGLGFAIPSSTVAKVVSDLMTVGYATGEPALGISVRAATPAESGEGGLYVVEVNPLSDAWAQGLRPGDVLLRANGIQLDTVDDLLALRTGLAAGDTMELMWLSPGSPSLRVAHVALMDQGQLQG